MINGIGLLDYSSLFSQQPAPAPQQAGVQLPNMIPRAQINEILQSLNERTQEVADNANEAVRQANHAVALAHNANHTAINAMQMLKDLSEKSDLVLNRVNQASEVIAQVQQIPQEAQRLAQDAIANLQAEYNRVRNELAESARVHHEQEREARVQEGVAKIQEKHRLGIFEQEERIRAQAAVDIEAIRWSKIDGMIGDPYFWAKIVLSVTAIAAGIYLAKHGIPMMMNWFKQPCVVSETSKTDWFGWGGECEEIRLADLIFQPALQHKLYDLILRIQSAKMYNENLPNVLLYGAPGTGKTAFAKALAYHSGLDYALTSGSEFAKITDLNLANNELRNLLDWADGGDKGLIVFIDEAESLFANRKLPSTPKLTQDFINTFLALVPEKSQKKVMFIFATNHPFKLDDAILNRIGINIEFVLPEASEREKILATYLAKFAQENNDCFISLHPKILDGVSVYADSLKGLSPRAIKFVAEEMIVNARRQHDKQLTPEIVQDVLDDAIYSLKQTEDWKREQAAWVKMEMQ